MQLGSLKWEYSLGARERDIHWTYGHRLKFSIFSLCSSPGRQLIRKTYCREESSPLSEHVTQIPGSIQVWWQPAMIWQWTNLALLILEGWPCQDFWARPFEDGPTSSLVVGRNPFLLTRHRSFSSWSKLGCFSRKIDAPLWHPHKDRGSSVTVRSNTFSMEIILLLWGQKITSECPQWESAFLPAENPQVPVNLFVFIYFNQGKGLWSTLLGVGMGSSVAFHKLPKKKNQVRHHSLCGTPHLRKSIRAAVSAQACWVSTRFYWEIHRLRINSFSRRFSAPKGLSVLNQCTAGTSYSVLEVV